MGCTVDPPVFILVSRSESHSKVLTVISLTCELHIAGTPEERGGATCRTLRQEGSAQDGC